MEPQNHLKDQTTCFSCKRILKEPKLLQCLHSYCSSCLENKTVGVQDEEIVCEKCLEKHKVPKKQGNEEFPRDILAEALIHLGKTGNKADETVCSSCEQSGAVAVNRCLDCSEFLCIACSEIHQKLRQTRNHRLRAVEEESPGIENEEELIVHRQTFCSLHSDEELKYFCENTKCMQAICRECTIINHKKHKYVYMEDSSECKELVKRLKSFSKKLHKKTAKLEKAIAEVNDTSDLITASITGLKHSVTSTASEVIRAIRVIEEQMIHEIDRVQSRKFHGLRRQVKELQKNLDVFEYSKHYTNNALKYLSAVELYLVKDVLSERLLSLSEKKLNLTPIEDNDLKHIRLPEEELRMAKKALGYLEVNGNSVINGCLRDSTDSFSGKQNVLESNKDIKDITVNIRGPGGEWLCPVKVEHDSPGNYGADFQTERLGMHDVIISVDGVVSRDKETQVLIGPPAQPMNRQHVLSSYSIGGGDEGNIGDIHGIAVDHDGRVVATDTKYHQIKIFDVEGKLQRSFGCFGSGMEQFSSPHDVLMDKKGNLLIADTGNHRIQIFDKNLAFLRSIDCHGNNDVAFQPYAIAISDHGNIITVDRELCKLRMYSNQGNMKHEFGELGSNNGQFINPCYVTMSPDGHVLVSDMGNNRIQVFTASGKYLSQFGRMGTGNGELRWPTGIAVKLNGDVIVADSCNHRVQLFRSDGSFLHACANSGPGRNVLKSPQGVVVRDNKIYVGDWGNNCVQVLDIVD